MIAKTSGHRWTLSALAAALLIGSAPVAYAQCAAGGTTAQTSGEEQAEAATGESGMTVGQSLTPAEQPDAEITTNQGGTTTDQSGAATPQTGTTGQGTGATAQAGQGAMEGTSEETATAESRAISGADEERLKTLLEQEGYTEVSSIVSCGTYYEADATQGGKQVTVQIDLETGRISPPQ
jgi:hypothetical protein